VKSLVKAIPVQVMLSEEERRDLDRVVDLRKRQNKDARIGRGTVLRELALAQVREILAESDRKVAA